MGFIKKSLKLEIFPHRFVLALWCGLYVSVNHHTNLWEDCSILGVLWAIIIVHRFLEQWSKSCQIESQYNVQPWLNLKILDYHLPTGIYLLKCPTSDIYLYLEVVSYGLLILPMFNSNKIGNRGIHVAWHGIWHWLIVTLRVWYTWWYCGSHHEVCASKYVCSDSKKSSSVLDPLPHSLTCPNWSYLHSLILLVAW